MAVSPTEGTLNREAELSLPPLRVPRSLVRGGSTIPGGGRRRKELAHQGYRVSDCESELSHRQLKIPPSATWMEPGMITPSEASRTRGDNTL